MELELSASDRAALEQAKASDRPVAWLTDQTGAERLRRCGLRSSKVDWLPT